MTRKRKAFAMELWLGVPKWSFQVSSLGHIRRSRGNRPVRISIDKEGYYLATLDRRNGTAVTYYLDSIIASVFHGRKLSHNRPLHLNGLAWDNWPSNLRWGMNNMTLGNGTNLVLNYSVYHMGQLCHGPFTDWRAAYSAAMRVGDIVIGRNPKREIVTFEVNFSRSRDVSPRNPFDLVNKYRAFCRMHPNESWALELSEAAAMIEALAVREAEALPAPGFAKLQPAAPAPLRPRLRGAPAPTPVPRPRPRPAPPQPAQSKMDWPLIASRPRRTREPLAAE